MGASFVMMSRICIHAVGTRTVGVRVHLHIRIVPSRKLCHWRQGLSVPEEDVLVEVFRITHGPVVIRVDGYVSDAHHSRTAALHAQDAGAYS